jgi:hypothetical protein
LETFDQNLSKLAEPKDCSSTPLRFRKGACLLKRCVLRSKQVRNQFRGDALNLLEFENVEVSPGEIS